MTLDGSVSVPLFVVLIVFAPVEAGVYVNVPVVFPVVMLTDDGVNVPPAPESLGVIVTVPVAAAFKVTVKFDEAVPGFPVAGLGALSV